MQAGLAPDETPLKVGGRDSAKAASVDMNRCERLSLEALSKGPNAVYFLDGKERREPSSGGRAQRLVKSCETGPERSDRNVRTGTFGSERSDRCSAPPS